MKKLLLYLFLPILFTSCASNYRPIQPHKLNYNSINKKDTVEFAYQYDVLQAAGNKKLAKKEEKHDIRLVAIQITNNSEHELEIGPKTFIVEMN